MKRLVWFAVSGAMMLAACQEKTSYIIRGTMESAKDGDMVYLQEFTEDGYVTLDSTTVKDGTFEFTGTSDSVAVTRYVHLNEGKPTTLFVEEGTVSVVMTPEESRVSGTSNNDLFQEFKDEYQRINDEMNGIYMRAKTDSTLSAFQQDSLMQVVDEMYEARSERALQMISDNITTAAGVELLGKLGSSFPVLEVQPLLEKVPVSLASNYNFVRLKEYVETVVRTSEGKEYIDFALNTPEGKEVKLSDYVAKNKYTLVDFWASWCGPCRREMPNVVNAYAKYKAKGFGVVGVSLDTDMEKWKKGISDLKITWPQMSDLKGWQNAAAGLYGIRSIPSTVLIAQDGTIVARGLHGEDLGNKLAELMK